MHHSRDLYGSPDESKFCVPWTGTSPASGTLLVLLHSLLKEQMYCRLVVVLYWTRLLTLETQYVTMSSVSAFGIDASLPGPVCNKLFDYT